MAKVITTTGRAPDDVLQLDVFQNVKEIHWPDTEIYLVVQAHGNPGTHTIGGASRTGSHSAQFVGADGVEFESTNIRSVDTEAEWLAYTLYTFHDFKLGRLGVVKVGGIYYVLDVPGLPITTTFSTTMDLYLFDGRHEPDPSNTEFGLRMKGDPPQPPSYSSRIPNLSGTATVYPLETPRVVNFGQYTLDVVPVFSLSAAFGPDVP